MSELRQYRVAVTVIIDADAADEHDARTIAQQAVEEALPQGSRLTTRTYTGDERAARVHLVCEVGRALRDGLLAITPVRR
ncbi:hypothetical protein L3Q65_00195 (plasmid) [Amycolatopsis sp. FU40]|uniref:hypothetical protein n=1 Tax=Amycolatopsis sp. FU40 TaxID=2914159 RepID=UPI001F28BF80|nr:hypothetical protein [Amycolatopsis sp. FU40]UKD50719.1 hypothetical protein L3Q65_00195 [Amycolatopsis sp. FU40]